MKRFLILTAVTATALAVAAPVANAHSISKGQASRMADRVALAFARSLAEQDFVESVEEYYGGACEPTGRPGHRHRWLCGYAVRFTRTDGAVIDGYGPATVRFRKGSRRIVGIRGPATYEFVE